MQTRWWAGVIGTTLALGGTAFAQSPRPQQGSGTANDPGMMDDTTGSQGSRGTGSQGSMGAGSKTTGSTTQGSMGATNTVAVQGVVGGVKKDKLTVMAPLGQEVEIADVGDAVIIDRELKFVSLEGKVDKNMKVTRDGKEAKVTSLKEGDFVRASWDAQNKKFTDIQATSSDQLQKQHGPDAAGMK